MKFRTSLFRLPRNIRFAEGEDGGEGGGGDPAPILSPAWLDTLAAEDKALAEAKGWKDPVDVLQNYRELEKFTGVPKDRLVKIPDSDGDWEPVYTQLGRPSSPDGYDYEVPEGGDANLAEWARGTFHKLGLSKTQGEGFLKEYDDFAKGFVEESAETLETELAAQQLALKQEWGAAYDAQMKQAKAGARALGLADEVIDGLQKQVGFDGVMKAMQQVGAKVGEDTFVGGGPGETGDMRVMTPQQAQDRLTELKATKEWADKYRSGDPKARRESEALLQMAYPE